MHSRPASSAMRRCFSVQTRGGGASLGLADWKRMTGRLAPAPSSRAIPVFKSMLSAAPLAAFWPWVRITSPVIRTLPVSKVVFGPRALRGLVSVRQKDVTLGLDPGDGAGFVAGLLILVIFDDHLGGGQAQRALARDDVAAEDGAFLGLTNLETVRSDLDRGASRSCLKPPKVLLSCAAVRARQQADEQQPN